MDILFILDNHNHLHYLEDFEKDFDYSKPILIKDKLHFIENLQAVENIHN